MVDFNLKNIKDLLSFSNLSTTDAEYMKELSSLSKIELDSEPLYVLAPHKRIFFTPKLRYYSRLLEKEVNRHLNAANKLLVEQNSEELSKFVLKQTREAVMTLVNDANAILSRHDPIGEIWANLCSENPDYDLKSNSSKELIVFCHNSIAELSRCWLEMQDRYAYLIGTDGLYDIDLFYSSTVKRQPTEFFKLKQSEGYIKEAKGFKKYRTDCSFLYENDEYFTIALQELTNKLKKHRLIEEEVDLYKMESLFKGHSCRITIKWIGDKSILTWIIKELCPDENPTVTTWPEGIGIWNVVSCRFVDTDGKPISNEIRKNKRPKTKMPVVNEVVDALKAYK